MKIRSLLRWSLAAQLVALSVPSAAVADVPPPMSESLSGDAKASYEGAKLLFDDHDYVGAATKYRAAYDASHDPRLFWNIASCEKEMRHYARASALVDRFVAEASALVAPDFLEQAKATQTALRDLYSEVRVNVTPGGALLRVDGEEIGRAPFITPVTIDLGKHVLRVEKEGFAPREVPIEVAGHNTMTVEVVLKAVDAGPTTAVLAVLAPDPLDIVTVDGQVVGSGKWEGVLPPGVHQVKVTADSKVPYVADVELRAGDHRSLEPSLQDEKKGGAIWPWLLGGGVVVAGAAVGAYFILKPSNTEGPAPQGALGTVYLNPSNVRMLRR